MSKNCLTRRHGFGGNTNSYQKQWWPAGHFRESFPGPLLFVRRSLLADAYCPSTLQEHYNYFRDYDPTIGRYVESDLIGLRGGINTYGYVSANPLNLIDILGLAEICRKYFDDDWRQVARDWKVVGYESYGFTSDLLGRLLDALSSIQPGGFSLDLRPRFPIHKDLVLEQLYKKLVEVCVDECSGRETSRRTVRSDPTRKFRENEVISSGTRRGNPLPFMDTLSNPSMNDRWGPVAR